MKKSLLTLILLAGTASAQTVQVTQGFVDDATRSFGEVRALRTLTDAQKSELEAKNALVDALKAQISAQKAENESQAILITALKQQNEILAKKTCQKTSFLFGAITVKKCS